MADKDADPLAHPNPTPVPAALPLASAAEKYTPCRSHLPLDAFHVDRTLRHPPVAVFVAMESVP
jgi:hypothetical protein